MGRPNQSRPADIQKQAQVDAAIRNQVEGKFGVGKRRFRFARVRRSSPQPQKPPLQ